MTGELEQRDVALAESFEAGGARAAVHQVRRLDANVGQDGLRRQQNAVDGDVVVVGVEPSGQVEAQVSAEVALAPVGHRRVAV